MFTLKHFTQSKYVLKPRQQGNVLVMFVIGLAAILIMAALALDGGHLLLNKSRLQNIADAAALNAAITLDEGGTHQQARAAAAAIINANLDHQDNFELDANVDMSNLNSAIEQVTTSLRVQFSLRPDPFEATNVAEARYVLVYIEDVPLNNFLAGVFDFNKQVSATAMAGPSTALVDCYSNLVPLMVCANDPTTEHPSSTVDGEEVFDQSIFYGIHTNTLQVLKIPSNTEPEIGPGNFQLIRLGDNKGADDIRDTLAGQPFEDGQICLTSGVDGDTVPTEPGNTVGPSFQGLNTRMGQWEGNLKDNQEDFPADYNTCESTTPIALDNKGDLIDNGAIDLAYRHSDYLSYYGALADDDESVPDACPTNFSGSLDPVNGSSQRRILQVVVGDCTDRLNGQNDVPYLGVGCFFLTQSIDKGGKNSFIVGEFVENCSAEGVASGDAEDRNGPYRIVLYHVPGSGDS
ncbi:pilus assembly protein TadG-related protein [Paraferrimonas sedimenticola]|uniref:Putative Flp pilus-assembly TadG-like N-terminal domain-containing protein n=1 Tax=Paraferrimonas sedimenticola TaxID=375674 RepID=A0AA37VSR5_9GAMM|nr:pilus assembly protein TadG-related protein [Paraferrimonas sedimenticola]GLP94901.1 hypothetical protein GCM10007895_02070 [Paraferrimonas sedimenticola]